jgi:hypothetical protein
MMAKQDAFEMMRALGKTFTKELVGRNIIEPGDGFNSDLFNGLAAVIKLELTDKDIPGVERAFGIVMDYATKLAFESYLEKETA